MSFFKKLKNSKHFSVLAKKKESITTLVEDLNHRHLIVYHIDSETEGNFSLTVKVGILLLIINLVVILKKFIKIRMTTMVT